MSRASRAAKLAAEPAGAGPAGAIPGLAPQHVPQAWRDPVPASRDAESHCGLGWSKASTRSGHPGWQANRRAAARANDCYAEKMFPRMEVGLGRILEDARDRAVARERGGLNSVMPRPLCIRAAGTGITFCRRWVRSSRCCGRRAGRPRSRRHAPHCGTRARAHPPIPAAEPPRRPKGSESGFPSRL